MTGAPAQPSRETSVNQIMTDGLLAVDQCTRPIRYRDANLILQDTCTPEPRTGLSVFEDSGDSAYQELDVLRATRLRDALDAFLQNAAGARSWQYDGVIYNLEAAWQGRPGTGLEGIYFRATGESRDRVPLLKAVDCAGLEPSSYAAQTVTLAEVLGLQPCPVHGIFSAPCYKCILDNVTAHLRGDETAHIGPAEDAKPAGWNPRCTGTADCQCSSCWDGPLGCGD